jgi:hypothetical protein|tara:strand:+ start:763 stop:1827 length:1065 start_codon:yes stop_codon:yes gene_type:complete
VSFFKNIGPDDVSKKPFKVFKTFTVSHADSSSAFIGVEGITGSLYKFTPSTAPVRAYSSSVYPYSSSYYSEPLFYQIRHMFYGGTGSIKLSEPINTFGPNETDKMYRVLHDKKCNVISVPQQYYGERINPGSIKLTDNSSDQTLDIRDDGDGNLYDFDYSASYAAFRSGGFDGANPETGSVLGNAFYDFGLVVFTNTGSIYQNVGLGGYHKNDGANGWELEFKSVHEITEYEYTCTVEPGEFNATTNISATEGYSGSTTIVEGVPSIYNFFPPGDNPAQRGDFSQFSVGSGSFNSSYQATENYIGEVTHSEWSPYVTTIGLYDNFNRLLMIGKLAKPVKNDKDMLLKFVIRLDV